MATDLIIRNNAICFGERLATSNSFKALFRDGMALVEETAAYLDGDGRQDAKTLSRTAALAYASESMRLTTRLMQIASWLLLQRAVNEGEMTSAEASSDKRRTRLAWQSAATIKEAEALPERLVALIEGSFRLQERVVRLDGAIGENAEIAREGAPAHHPLARQMSLLREAFCEG